MDFGVGLFHELWQDLYVSNDWHEAGVTVPSWHDMEMHMVGETSTSNSSHVHAKVEAVWMQRLADRQFAFLQQHRHFG